MNTRSYRFLIMLVCIAFAFILPAYSINGYYDSFNNLAVGADPSGWVTTGDWQIVTGTASGTWGVHAPYTKYYKHNSGSNIAYYDKTYANFDYVATIRMTAQSNGAIIFRRVNDSNYYYLKLNAVSNTAVLGKCVNGTNIDLSSINITIDPNISYHLRVTAVGPQITCKILPDNVAAYFRFQNPGTIVGNITDSSFSSGSCGFLASGGSNDLFNDVSVIDLALDKAISNSIFTLETGAYGQVKTLKFLNEPYDTNFVIDEMEHRYDVGKNQFLGEMKFKYQVGGGVEKTATTGDSEDIRNIVLDSANNRITVSYLANSSMVNGIQGASDFQVTETYSLVNDYFRMDITITNVSGQSIRFNDIGLPISWNNHWQFESPYKRYLAATANFISYNGSYLVLERAKGGGNKMVVIPDSNTDTSIEYRKFRSTQATWTNPPEEYYIKSNSIKSEGQGYLPSTYLDLANGASKTYTFEFHKVADDLEVGTKLYNEGLIDITVNPGMIFPTNITAEVDLHTTKTINSITASDPANTTITFAETRPGDHKIYNMSFNKLGRNDVTINYDGGKKCVLQFWLEEPIDAAIQRHVDFIINNLRITNPNDGNYKGFLEWHNQLNYAKTGGNGQNNNDFEQMYDGPAFIAEKNVYYPVQSEITIIDEYLDGLVLAKEVFTDPKDPDYGWLKSHIIKPDGSLVWCWGDDTNLTTNPRRKTGRIYNYARFYNTFYSMYLVAKNYPHLTFSHPRTFYLEIAGAIAKVGTSISQHTGTMGEQTIPEIISALKAEGKTTLANELSNLAHQKGLAMSKQAYPFGSEYGTDSTGEEGAYTFSQYANNTAGMKTTIDKSLAWTGKIPVWYWQTTGNRQDMDWWLFQYTVGLHGKIFEDYYMNHVSNGKDYWSIVYPFNFAPFVHIISGQPETYTDYRTLGSVWWNYRSSDPYNWNIGWPYNESGEADISLWAGLRLLSADVVINDPSFGLAGYGCDVTDAGTTYNITPKDGLFRRLNVVDNKLAIQLQNDRYTFAKVGKINDSIELTLSNVAGVNHSGTISVKGLISGNYDVLVDGVIQGTTTVAVAGDLVDFTYSVGTNANYNVVVRKNSSQVLVAKAGSDVTVRMPSAIANLAGSVIGTPSIISWSKKSGPGTVTFGNAKALNTTATFSAIGTYELTLSVSDGTTNSSDNVIVTVTAPIYEAEDASHIGFPVGTSFAGYSGTGYISNFRNNDVNNNIEFTVNSAAAGNATMTLRYIHEFSTPATNLGLYVNGTKIKDLSLPGTGGSSVWGDATETIAVNAGANKIKINIESKTDLTLNAFDYILVDTPASTPAEPNIALHATASTSYVSSWESLKAINDGFDPAHSNDRAHAVYGNWPQTGTQWVEYDFGANYTISSTDVYWFDDNLGIDLPASCAIKYWNGTAYVNVANASGLGVLGGQYNKTTFTPVTTNKIRLEMTGNGTFSTGLLEWKVYGSLVSGQAIVYEAENATLHGMAVATRYPGYSGTGYVFNFRNNVANNSVEFAVNVAAAGNYTLTLRYASEFTAVTNLGLYVNGTKVKNLSFPYTGWNVWGDLAETVSLNAGSNTIKINIESSTDQTLNGLDYIRIK